ncbi:hypothetical protein BWZ20_09335 [Winogradskyella sp. J14-2]|uniref:hypothetical protein n=1 Tax=Winogradskyella sp. J14-2 TaxID=1936080 RepID=UPI000972A149|nr:hypothetical protein [Winogradskyella sp. J14-2]APY08489.1 hypothetical protein BWZ20_09335 [Winogradskyella sp. J14-2]
MKILRIFIISMLVFFSCKNEEKQRENTESSNPKEAFNDSSYVLDPKFPIGDARRYGVTASTAKLKHPYTGKNRFTTTLDLAQEYGLEMTFPSGFYKMNLDLSSYKDLKLNFNNSEFSLIQIVQMNDSLPIPKNITLGGTLVAFDRLAITEAQNIIIDSIIIKSDKQKNLLSGRSRGCHIYHGSEDIKIKYLQVNDLGSDPIKDKYTHAALAIDGWNNNPVNVQIEEIYIKSTDRHGIYITGKDHLIGDVIIDRFGVGSSEGMDGMQDAQLGEEKEFKALWINKCYDSFIENITINEKDSKAKYNAHFDAGDKTRPFTIGNFKVINDNPKIDTLEEENSGVVIEIMD